MSAPPYSLSSMETAYACGNATGYEFRIGVPPTVPQLRAMCSQDDCIQQVNHNLLRPYYGPARTPLERTELFEFAYAVVDFCYYYRTPSDACPVDFTAQLMTDLHDLVAACETKSGFLFSNNNSTVPVTSMCGIDECENVLRRLYVKPYIRSCEPMFGLTPGYPPSFEPVMAKWVTPYVNSCGVSTTPAWYLPIKYFDSDSIKYVYLPGPVPTNTTATTAVRPAPTPTSAQTSKSIPPSEKPIPLPPLTAEPSPVPTKVIPVSSSASPVTAQRLEPSPTNAIVIPTPTSSAKADNSEREQSVSSRDSSSSAAISETEAIPHLSSSAPAVPAPTVQSTASSSNNAVIWSLFPCLIAIVGVLLAFVLHRRRRRAREACLKQDTYSSIADTELATPTAVDATLVGYNSIPLAQLEDVLILGGGGSGIVYLVRDKRNQNRLLASKRLNQKCKDDETDAFVAELALAASLDHPRIVAFVGISGLHKSDIQGVFEYMPGGDLCRYLSTQPPLDPTCHSWNAEKLQIAIDIADALAYIHTLTPMPVVHRDLKSRNVLLTNDKRAKLGDFGVSRPASTAGSMTTGIGTSRWVAPEVILGGGEYSTECDIYSFGVVLTELDTHRLPFSELVNLSGDPLADFVILEMVATGRCQPSLRATCPPPIRDLAMRCLSFAPHDRPTAPDVASALRQLRDSEGLCYAKLSNCRYYSIDFDGHQRSDGRQSEGKCSHRTL